MAKLTHEIEKRRIDHIKLLERRMKGETEVKRKTPEQIEKEKMDARWKFGKVFSVQTNMIDLSICLKGAGRNVFSS